MSNSPLVDYTLISPNRTSPRRDTIKKITIHHMAGNLSVETCGNVFAPSSAQASANYGISTDGKVGLYVEEKDRAWTSSSPDNDNQAVTIEVANDQIGGNWHVSDTALSKLIELCTDICRRNGISKLNYTGDTSGNLTMHKWFASTNCPGPYLESKFPYIAEQVNKNLIGETTKPEPVSDVESTIWNFLKGKGLSDCGAAGIMGNLFAESSLKSNNLQNSYENSLGYSDESYTQAVDNGSYDNFIYDSAGYGLAQWTYWSRKQNLLHFAKSKQKSIGDLSMQLDFLYFELSENYKYVLDALKSATSVWEASNCVLFNFEAPADQGESVQQKRAEYGEKYYNKFVSNKATISNSELPIGSEVYFSGTTHYVSSTDTNGKTCKPGLARITAKAKSGAKHEYHVIGVSKNCNVYGWVDKQFLVNKVGKTTADLNLREGDNIGTVSKGIMGEGTKVFILGTSSSGWYKVYSEDLNKTGYCSNNYISFV